MLSLSASVNRGRELVVSVPFEEEIRPPGEMVSCFSSEANFSPCGNLLK